MFSDDSASLTINKLISFVNNELKKISIGLGLTKWQQRSIYWKIPFPLGKEKVSADVSWGGKYGKEKKKGENIREKGRKGKKGRMGKEKEENGE